MDKKRSVYVGQCIDVGGDSRRIIVDNVASCSCL